MQSTVANELQLNTCVSTMTEWSSWVLTHKCFNWHCANNVLNSLLPIFCGWCLLLCWFRALLLAVACHGRLLLIPEDNFSIRILWYSIWRTVNTWSTVLFSISIRTKLHSLHQWTVSRRSRRCLSICWFPCLNGLLFSGSGRLWLWQFLVAIT